jgi:hypothetical protein
MKSKGSFAGRGFFLARKIRKWVSPLSSRIASERMRGCVSRMPSER